MAGPLVQVDTQTAKINLDVSRALGLGNNAILRFVRPQSDGSGGVEILGSYTTGFDRLTDEEREIGDGQTVIFEIADVYAPGQLRGHIANAEFLRLDIDGVEGSLYGDLDASEPAPNEGQVWHITCRTTQYKDTYLRRRQ